jgi:hypothetical protein
MKQTCWPSTFTGLSGNGVPIGWNAQVSSFAGGFGIVVVVVGIEVEAI